MGSDYFRLLSVEIGMERSSAAVMVGAKAVFGLEGGVVLISAGCFLF